jgi:hypothetical protein
MLDLHQKKGFANRIDVMMIPLSVYELHGNISFSLVTELRS